MNQSTLDKLNQMHLWGMGDYSPARKLDKNLIMRLADCSYIERAENVIITGAIASQLPYEKWYDVITEKTIADAIMERLINSSHRITLGGESMRKKK